jgi:ribosomal protein L24E
MMFVKKDGTAFLFCSAVCRRDQLNLGRVGHRFKWTRAYQSKKALEMSQAAASEARTEAKPAGKPKPATPVAPPSETVQKAEEPKVEAPADPAKAPPAPNKKEGAKPVGTPKAAKPSSEAAKAPSKPAKEKPASQ